MGIEHLFEDASRVMTVVSFATFCGILAWTFLLNRERDFASVAALPFADKDGDEQPGEDYV